MKVRRLLREEQEERLRQEICPRCKKFNLVRVNLGSHQRPHLRYRLGEDFWACSSVAGAFCYLLSGVEDDTIFETSDDTTPVDFYDFHKPRHSGKIVRRRAGEIFEIRKMHTTASLEDNRAF